MSRPRLLDLYSGAGGAARGYQQAGFHVTGVDIEPQPNYCGDAFIQADALEFLRDDVLRFPGEHGWAAIHASPVCKAFTKTGWAYHFGYHDRHEDLLTPTCELLNASDVEYVIENVPGAPMRVDVKLCGSQFGLGVRRHRWFELSWPLFELMTPCDHSKRVWSPHGRPNGLKGNRHQWSEAMSIDWMPRAEELAQAIPPAYTEWIGSRLLAHLESVRTA